MSDTWDGTDRRKSPDPESLQAEIRATRQDLGRLAASVTVLGSDERLQKVVDSVVEEEQRHRQGIMSTIVIGLMVVGSLTFVGLIYAGAAKDAAVKAKAAAENSAKVAGYVDHCLVHPSEATPGECGNTAATGAQSTAVLAIFCYLRVAPVDRSDANARECFERAADQAKVSAAATTTTTGG